MRRNEICNVKTELTVRGNIFYTRILTGYMSGYIHGSLSTPKKIK